MKGDVRHREGQQTETRKRSNKSESPPASLSRSAARRNTPAAARVGRLREVIEIRHSPIVCRWSSVIGPRTVAHAAEASTLFLLSPLAGERSGVRGRTTNRPAQGLCSRRFAIRKAPEGWTGLGGRKLSSPTFCVFVQLFMLWAARPADRQPVPFSSASASVKSVTQRSTFCAERGEIGPRPTSVAAAGQTGRAGRSVVACRCINVLSPLAPRGSEGASRNSNHGFRG